MIDHLPVNPGVYRFTNLDTDKVYIGSSAKSVRIRCKNHIKHLNAKVHCNKYFQNAWHKTPLNNWCIDVLTEFPAETSEEIIIEHEQYWIDLYRAYDKTHGYNISPSASGGNGTKGRKMLPETIERMKIAQQKLYTDPAIRTEFISRTIARNKDPINRAKVAAGLRGKPLSEEHKANIKASLTGRKLSEEHKRAISDGGKGKECPPERRAKLRASNLGQKRSPEAVARIKASRIVLSTPEVRAKMSAAHIGVPLSEEHRASIGRANTGRVFTEESKAKISAANRGKVRTPEQRAKMVIAQRKRYETKPRP